MKPTKLILFFFFVWCLVLWCSGALVFAQSKLEVSGDIDTPSLALDPFPTASAPTPSALAGEAKIYYDTDSNDVYLSEKSAWGPVAIPKNVATIIVAAIDSLDPNKADPAYRCTGTNDQERIQAAIGACPAGGAVYLLEGTYNISGSINFNNTAPNDSNKSLIGAGAGTMLQLATGTSSVNVINASNVNGILISQLRIDGNNVGVVNRGIYFNNVTYSKIDKVWVENLSNDGIMFYASCNNNIISNNNIQRNSYDGINFYTSCNNNIISNNNIQESGVVGEGIRLTSSNNNTLSGNNIQGTGLQGIQIRGSSNNIISNNNVQGNGVSSGGYQGISLYASISFPICSNNIISNNNVQGNGAEGIRLYASSSSFVLSRNIISNNNVQGNKRDGIRLEGFPSDNLIYSNIIYNNGETDYDGIRIDGSSNLISSNYISDTAGATYAVNITSGSNSTYLVGNQIIPWSGWSGAINDSGTNTKYTGKDKITLEPVTATITGPATTVDPRNPPASHIVFNNTSGLTQALILADGRSAGDILILENSSVNSVTISESTSDINLSTGHQPTVTLGQYDTLELIWNGDPLSPKWVEVSWTNVP